MDFLEKNRYIERWNNPFFLIPGVSFLIGGAIWVGTIFYDMGGGQGIFGMCIAAIGTFMCLVLVRSYFTYSYDIFIEEKELRTFSLFRQKWNIKFSDISAILFHRNFGAWGIKLVPIQGRSIIIGASVTKFGELVEHILEKADSIKQIDDEKIEKILMSRPDLWAKEANIQSLNRAKMRAKENKSVS